MDYALIITITLALVGIWLLLCQLGIIPDPYAKHSLKIAGAILSLGAAVLAVFAWGRSSAPEEPEPEKPPQPDVVVEKGPTKDDIKKQDEEIKEAESEADDIHEKLEDIDRREAAGPDDDDPDAGSAFEELLGVSAEGDEGEDLP